MPEDILGFQENLKYLMTLVSFVIRFFVFFLPAVCGSMANYLLRVKFKKTDKLKHICKALIDTSLFAIAPTIGVMIYHTLMHHGADDGIWAYVSFTFGFFGREISKRILSLPGLFSFLRDIKGLMSGLDNISSDDILKNIKKESEVTEYTEPIKKEAQDTGNEKIAETKEKEKIIRESG